MPREARGRSAGDRHHVDIGVAVVLRAEGDRPAVGGEHRARLGPVIGRQAADVLPVNVGDEEIPRIDERDAGGADRRLGQHLRIDGIDPGAQGRVNRRGRAQQGRDRKDSQVMHVAQYR